VEKKPLTETTEQNVLFDTVFQRKTFFRRNNNNTNNKKKPKRAANTTTLIGHDNATA